MLGYGHSKKSFVFSDNRRRETPEESATPSPHPFQRQESNISILGTDNPNIKQGPTLPLSELQVKEY